MFDCHVCDHKPCLCPPVDEKELARRTALSEISTWRNRYHESERQLERVRGFWKLSVAQLDEQRAEIKRLKRENARLRMSLIISKYKNDSGKIANAIGKLIDRYGR